MRLQHVSIEIPRTGADAARSFYGSVLGLEERDVPAHLDPSEFIWFRLGGDLELHLMFGDDAPPRRPHFCLAVEDDLAGWRTRLDASGFATQDTTDIVGRPRFFVLDPFGNRVELTQFTP